MIDKIALLNWVGRSLASLGDDVYLLEHDVSERCVTAKLASYLHGDLPSLVGEANAEGPSEDKLHVDCEYNRFGDDTKWFPWTRTVIGAATNEMYFCPIPDIILHRRGPEGPNVLVIEAKKHAKVNSFNALMDRLKLIGYLGPNMSYSYGLFLCVGVSGHKQIVEKAELIEYEPVRKAMKGAGSDLWKKATKLVEVKLSRDGRVYICREPDDRMIAEAGDICAEMVKVFSFTDVRESLVATR